MMGLYGASPMGSLAQKYLQQVGDIVNFDPYKKKLLEGGWMPRGGMGRSAQQGEVVQMPGTAPSAVDSIPWARTGGTKTLKLPSARDSAQTSFGGDMKEMLRQKMGIPRDLKPGDPHPILDQVSRGPTAAAMEAGRLAGTPDPMIAWAAKMGFPEGRITPKTIENLRIGMGLSDNEIKYYFTLLRQRGEL